MLLFDWKKVYAVAEGNILECNRIMKMLTNKSVPTNIYDPIYRYSNISFRGPNYLLHPDILLYNAYKYTPKEISIYYALSALRNIGDFTSQQMISLESLKAPVALEQLKQNRLLRIDANMIHFIYEEVTKENTH